MITTTDITLGTLYFNGEVCTDPIIDLIGVQNVAIKCIDNDKGTYRVQTLDGSDLPACLSFIVKCGTCSECPPKVIDRCLCDTANDCSDPCSDCIGGICVTRCKPGEVCVNDTCVSCQTNTDCPCNQICTPTGCQCPTGTTLNPLNNCCDQCSTNADCPPCSDCINIGGANVCVARVCPDGVCDPSTGECVECLTSGDCADKSCTFCDPILKRCTAGEGQVQVGNDCVPAPDCTSDADCNDPCLSCGPAGTCIPIQCPPGKVPARIGNRCDCVEECDCDDPGSCSDMTKYCTAIGPETCGCLPCEGDCASGCQDPCYCDPLLNKCVANPCPDVACSNGTDCGPGCGCQNGKCVPCASLSCTDSSCAEVLGCKCAGLSCVADDCGNSPCTTAFDCPFGCTCDDGTCTGCSNYPCSPVDECTVQIGCTCVVGSCQGDPDAECNDNLALIKNDDNCSLTGSLETANCCQCSPLTLAIKGRRTTSTASEYNVVFQAELRKGEFNGVNVDGNPLLDNIADDNIAENEVPTSGTISYQAYTTFAIYKLQQSGQYVFTGNSTEGPTTGLASYIGGTAIVEFPEAAFKKIGVTEQVDSTTQREAVSVEVRFFQSSHLIAPNKCNYRAVVNVGTYNITSDDDWMNFEVGTATNGIATTVTSNVCRDPFFKWRKDGVLFRKLYVSGNNNVYSDLLENPPVDELEGCKTYALEVDCSCEKSISDLVTFCNPADINFNVTNCGKSFELVDFSTCGPNETAEFFIKGGDIDITFLGNNAPVGTVFDSQTCISELTYGLTCDPECTKTYINQCADFTIGFTTQCEDDGGFFDVTFDSTVTDQSGQTYGIDRIVIGGFTLTNGTGFTQRLKWGTYTAVIYPAGGCESFEQTVQQDCCEALVPEISRDCDGNVTCTRDPNVVYEVNGVIQTDICAYVNSLPADQSAQILVRKGSCRLRTITLPSLASFCCENFTFVIEQQNDTDALVQVYSAGENPTLSVSPSTGVTVTSVGPNEFSVTGLSTGQAYNFTVNSATCGSLTIPYNQTDCAIPVSLTQPAAPNCNSLIATVATQTCECKNGEFRSQATDVDTTGLDIRATFETSIQQFDAQPVSGSVVFIDQDGVETDFGCITCVNEVTFPRPALQDCLDGMSLLFSLQDDPNTDQLVTLEIEIRQGGVISNQVPEFSSVSVTVQGETVSTPNGNGVYIFGGCCMENTNVPISIIVNHTNGNQYTTAITGNSTIGARANYILSNVCTDGNDQVEVPLRLELRNLELEDGCTYPTVGRNYTYLANSEIISPTAAQTIGLSAIDPNAREVKFEWRKDGGLVFTDFQPNQSTLPEVYLEQGSDYRVTAICDPCQDSADKNFCCLPVVTFTDNAFDSFDITVTGLPGTYDLNVQGTPYTIILSGPGTTADTVTYNGPLTPGFDYSVILSISGTTCQDNYTYTAPSEVIPILEFTPCNPLNGTYSFTVVNAEDGWVATLVSGTGTIAQQGAGMQFTNLDEFDPPVFYVTARTVQSATVVGTSPTSCFSSSTAATSSSNPASSSIAASSSVAASSSNPESSGAPASSSNVVSSSVAASSSNVPSSASPPASSQASSSVAAASSSAVGSSSNVPPSSIIPSSSAIVTPSSCPTLLEITQGSTNCAYTLSIVNPDDNSNDVKVTYTNDEFFCEFDMDCRLTSSCEAGDIERTPANTVQMGARVIWRVLSLQVGDETGTAQVFDGTSWTGIDISPSGHTGSCGCLGCGSVNASDLTYSGSNGVAMAAAVKQAFHNGLCAAGFDPTTDFNIDAEFQSGEIRVQMLNKRNGSGFAYFGDNGGATGPSANEIFLRGASGIGTAVAGIVEFGDTPFSSSITPFTCSTTSECGALLTTRSISAGFSGSAFTYGNLQYSFATAGGSSDSNNCTHAELTATLTGGSCTPSYTWAGPFSKGSPTTQTVYVVTPGLYEVDVTGCTGCGTLEDSEVVV